MISQESDACLVRRAQAGESDAFEQIAMQEIAAFQETSTTTIKSRLRNARARLLKEWETLLEKTLTRDAETVSAHKVQLLPKLLRRIESSNWIRHLAF